MTPKTRIAPQDDIDRLKCTAFWYWEYMRRNPLYIRYCDVINKYDDYFKSLGVYDYMQSKEFLDEMSAYVWTHETREELKNFPFRKRLEKEFGAEAGRKTFKYGCLSCGFENHFGRIYKHYSIGMNTEKALDDELSGIISPFITNNPADISALIKLNGSWLITVDGDHPDNFCYDIRRAQNIIINPDGILDDPGKVGLEVYALNLINKAVESLFEEQKLADDTMRSVYKLSLAGKRFNNADLTRLAALWLWDKAHEKSDTAPLDFADVYPLLKTKLEKAKKHDDRWDQIFGRPSRIRNYYASTGYCIQHHTITTLNN